MLKKNQFNQYLEELFTPELIEKARKVDPKMSNGLQIPGTDEIKHVIVGVSISAALIDEALERGADTIITHHGLNMSYPYNLMLPQQALRLKLLLCNNLNLYGFHHVLDAHPELGHNAQLAKLLGARIVKPYKQDWGFIAELPQAIELQKLADKLKEILDHDIFVVEAGEDKKVKRLGLIAGAGMPRSIDLLQILEDQVDVHITGEIAEWNVYQFMEMGIAYMACGHNATEALGMKALTKKLQNQFKGKIKVEFIDIPNPI